jgi:hypothetical protein
MKRFVVTNKNFNTYFTEQINDEYYYEFDDTNAFVFTDFNKAMEVAITMGDDFEVVEI